MHSVSPGHAFEAAALLEPSAACNHQLGRGVHDSMLGPTFPLMPEQASLFESGVPFDNLLEGHSLWDSASMPETARS